MNRLPSLLATAGLVLVISAPAAASSLLEVYERAATEDAELRTAEAEYRGVLENRPITRSALLPQISGQAEAGAFYRDDRNRPGSDDGRQTSFGVNLSQSIYDRRNYIDLVQVDLEIARAEAELDSARQDLILRVSQAYFDVLIAQETLAFREAEVEAIERQLEQTERRFEVGLVARTDVTEAQAQRDLAEAERISAENQLDLTREQLAVITNTYWDQLDMLRDDAELTPPDPADPQAWVDIALANNLELAAQRLSTESAREQIQRQRAEGLPRINLNASVNENRYHGLDAGTTGGAMFFEGTEAQVGIQLEIPFYTGGRVSALTRQARENFQAAQEGQSLVERRTTQDTRSAYLSVISNNSRVRALEQALASTQSAFEAAEAGFEVGTRTQVDVLLALREVFRAERDYAEARYGFLSESLRLQRAAGRLSVTDLEAINRLLE
ncbi:MULTISPECIES: TolC family outer membrane protein [Thioalkalivibrio]|uniref:TolC family outer membrane protein n=1 Tax=Thioalkalivibrio TaxID=106633 RepID=UPI000364093C|nr:MULTISPECIES: TolC family outer membrane protein [Thioalkalivibrio]OOC47726.1 type I secretion protein TolC [Thioalkalivibrio versutus]